MPPLLQTEPRRQGSVDLKSCLADTESRRVTRFELNPTLFLLRPIISHAANSGIASGSFLQAPQGLAR
jgi:hypothetical protein